MKDLVSESLMPGRNLISWLPMLLLANGARDLKLVLQQKADTLNTPCSLILFKYKNKIKIKFIIDKMTFKNNFESLG